MANELLSPGVVPALDKIKPEDYMPAIDKAIEDVQQKLQKIKADPAAATFENTVAALESLFDKVSDVQLILGNESANNYSDALAQVEEAVSIKLSRLSKNIFQDQALGARFQAVYKQSDKLPLDEDDKAILRNLYQAFESSGAFLTPAGQQRIRKIDEDLISLAQKFTKNMKGAPLQQAVLITDPAELAGLSPDEVARLESNARENGHAAGWLFIPERLLVDEMLEHAESSSFRKKIFESLEQIGKHAPFDNGPVIAEMQKLRHEYAHELLGYDNYASFARSRAMTKDLPAVRQQLKDVAAKALPKFEEEMRSLEKFATDNGGPKTLEPWDVPYWVTRQREALFHFDSSAFAKNLQLENVLKGMFNEAGHVFGLAFRENTGKYPVIDPDTRTFDVINKEGTEVGILHVDLYARPGTKSGGAWMNQLQQKTDGKPNIVIFSTNITKPPKGKQALVALSQYVTMYHEFGHTLQGLQGMDVKYRSLQGTNGPSDFVEFHSMVNEHRATVLDNLRKYALNVDTGLPPDEKTLKALVDSRSFFESRELLKLVQNSLRDLEFHTIDPADYKGDQAIEDSVALKSPYAAHIRPYSLTRFDHLFSDAHSSYAAGYVNYFIAGLHAADGFEPFKKDPYDVAWSKRLTHLYNQGCGGDLEAHYEEYRGRPATTDAMLREAGIDPEPKKVPKKAAGPAL